MTSSLGTTLQPALTNLRAGARRSASFLLIALLSTACNEGDGPIAPEDPLTPSPSVTTVAGTVRSSTSGDPVAGAEVRLGAITVRTGADGQFELTGIIAGSTRLRCLAPGFEVFEADVTVPSDGLRQNISLTPAPLHIVGSVDALAQLSMKVDRKGNAVTDAIVTVNGVAIPHTGRGVYKGTLPGVIPSGDPVLLRVSSGGVTVEATGNVPETPILTTPVAGSAFEFPDTLLLTWTSTTDPDLFIGSMGQTSGDAREARIAASDIACDFSCDELTSVVSKTIGISAVRRLVGDRDFTGPVDVTSNFTIESVRSPAVITIKPAPLALPLFVFADMGANNIVGPWASVYVGDRSFYEPPDAVVTLNGTALQWFCPFGCSYGGPLPDLLAGSPLVLDIDVRGTRVTGTGIRPANPVLTSPAGGTAFTLADSITIRWASETDPHGFVLQAASDGEADGSVFVELGTVPGTSRQWTFAASTLGNHEQGLWQISIQALNEGSLTGAVDSESYMRIRSTEVEIPIVIGP